MQDPHREEVLAVDISNEPVADFIPESEMTPDMRLVHRVLNTKGYTDAGRDHASARLSPLTHPNDDCRAPFELDPRTRSACVLSFDDATRVAQGDRSFTVFRPQHYGCYELTVTDFMFKYDCTVDDTNVGYFYRTAYLWEDGSDDAVSGSGCDRWMKLCPELVSLCAEIDEEARNLSNMATRMPVGIPVVEGRVPSLD